MQDKVFAIDEHLGSFARTEFLVRLVLMFWRFPSLVFPATDTNTTVTYNPTLSGGSIVISQFLEICLI